MGKDKIWMLNMGTFKNGLLHGAGSMKSFATNITKEGWWQNGIYISTLYKHNLDVIMEKPPVGVSKEIAETWKSLGPFNSYKVASEAPPLVNTKTY